MRNFFLIVFLIGCSRAKKDEKYNTTLKDFSIYESISGCKNWILFADSAKEFKNNNYVIYGVRLVFLSEYKDTLSKLFSDSGFVYEETGNLVAYSNVNVITCDSIRILTDSLKWDNKIEKIIIEGPFKYWSKDEFIEAEGLESDRILKEIIIKKKIRGKGEFKK